MVGQRRQLLVVCGLAAVGLTACAVDGQGDDLVETRQPLLEEFIDSLPNNLPIPNGHGAAASYSTTTAPIVSRRSNDPASSVLHTAERPDEVMALGGVWAAGDGGALIRKRLAP